MGLDLQSIMAQIMGLLDTQQNAALDRAKVGNKLDVGKVIADLAGSGMGNSSLAGTVAGRQADEYSATLGDIGAKFAGERADMLLKLAMLQGGPGGSGDGSGGGVGNNNTNVNSSGFSPQEVKSMTLNDMNKNAGVQEAGRNAETMRLQLLMDNMKHMQDMNKKMMGFFGPNQVPNAPGENYGSTPTSTPNPNPGVSPRVALAGNQASVMPTMPTWNPALPGTTGQLAQATQNSMTYMQALNRLDPSGKLASSMPGDVVAGMQNAFGNSRPGMINTAAIDRGPIMDAGGNPTADPVRAGIQQLLNSLNSSNTDWAAFPGQGMGDTSSGETAPAAAATPEGETMPVLIQLANMMQQSGAPAQQASPFAGTPAKGAAPDFTGTVPSASAGPMSPEAAGSYGDILNTLMKIVQFMTYNNQGFLNDLKNKNYGK